VGSKRPQSTSALHKVVKHGAYKFWDWLAGQLIAASMTIFLFSLGIGYMVDDERVEEATVVATAQAGSKLIARDYHALWKAVDDAKKAALKPFPEEWHEPLKAWSHSAAMGVLVLGLGLLVWRAPSRAHAAQQIGWGIAAPGAFAAFATLVLEWRAMKGIKATLEGERSVSTLWSEGVDAAVENGRVLWPALAVGGAALVLGFLCERRWRKGGGTRQDGARLRPLHVISHGLMVGGAVPLLHYFAAIVLGAFTKGSSTGASMAPFTASPLLYAACCALFAFGAALWFLARAEVKKIEARGET
jgi:hypothetical protein